MFQSGPATEIEARLSRERRLVRPGALHAGVVMTLPRRVLRAAVPARAAPVLPVPGSRHRHAGRRAAPCLILAVLVLHGVRGVVIAIPLGSAHDGAGGRPPG